jgi:ribosomal-protein-alanine N-acetyltransferase
MAVRLETPRLELRPLELADAEQTQRLFPKWEVVRFLANHVPWPYPDDGALTYYRDSALPAMARGEEWHWSLRLKSDPNQLIGSVSLMKAENNNRGFWLGLQWQRQGLMSEAVEAVTGYWFDELGFSVLRAPKAAVNIASRRIS